MSDQMSFFGDARPTDRLFFGIYPPAPVAERIGVLANDLRTRHGLAGRPHATERFHITLHHIGDFAGMPNDIRAKCEAAAAALRFGPFDVAFDRAESFSAQPRNRPFVLQGGEGVSTLIDMRKALSHELMKVALPRVAASGFTPHVTLLYDDRAVEAEPVDPIAWTVTEFVLVHSLLGQTQHIPLKTWPLG